jgi:hypothetical protein
MRKNPSPTYQPKENLMDAKRVTLLVIAVVGCVLLLLSLGNLFENLDAGSNMVIQSPLSGNLACYTTPGVKWQGFGKITKYAKRSEFWFSSKSDQGKKGDESLRIRFNDGGHANISGGISWECPIDEEHLTMIHTKFGSQEAVEQALVRKAVEKGVYMTGPHMSSKESYAERRNELLYLIEDQIANGVYLTKTTQEKTKDPLTGEERTVAKVEMVTDAKTSQPKRAEDSPLKEFGVKTFNLAINEIKYDDTVEKQIMQQQEAIMQVQTAIAESKKAEQEAITAKKTGEAAAAKVEWEAKAANAKLEQEALIKKLVAETEATQKLEVAKLDAQAAEEKKKGEISLGEGESKRRTMVMEADGALTQKLEAWVEAQKAYATAIGQHQGNWVPQIVMGGGSVTQTNGASDLIQMLMVKTAKDLSLDMEMKPIVKPVKK